MPNIVEFLSFILQAAGAVSLVLAVAAALTKWLGGVWASRLAIDQKGKLDERLQKIGADNARELEALKITQKGELDKRMQEIGADNTRELEALKSRFQVEFETVRRESARQLQDLQSASAVLTERTKAALAREAFTHTLQFKTEFEAYTRVWVAFVVARKAAYRVVPSFKDESESAEVRFQKWSGAVHSLQDAIHDVEPFVVESVYVELKRTLEVVGDLGVAKMAGPAPRGEGRALKDSINIAHEKMVEVSTTVAAAIRRRTGAVSADGGEVIGEVSAPPSH